MSTFIGFVVFFVIIFQVLRWVWVERSEARGERPQELPPGWWREIEELERAAGRAGHVLKAPPPLVPPPLEPVWAEIEPMRRPVPAVAPVVPATASPRPAWGSSDPHVMRRQGQDFGEWIRTPTHIRQAILASVVLGTPPGLQDDWIEPRSRGGV